MNIEFSKTNTMFLFKSIRDIQNFAKSEFNLNLNTFKKSSIVKKVIKKNSDLIEIYLDGSKRFSCGVNHKIAAMFKKSNPECFLKLDSDLADMEEDEELVFKSKNPLWVLQNQGNVILLKRIY